MLDHGAVDDLRKFQGIFHRRQGPRRPLDGLCGKLAFDPDAITPGTGLRKGLVALRQLRGRCVEPLCQSTREQWVGADGTTYAKLSGPDVNAIFRFPATAPYDPATVLMLPTQAELLLAWFQDHTNGSSSAHEAVFDGEGHTYRAVTAYDGLVGAVAAVILDAAVDPAEPPATTSPKTQPTG